LGFAFYFGLWHSLLSFNVIKQQLQIKNSWSGWKQLIVKALPYSLVAWIGLMVIMYFGTRKYSLPEIVSYLFIGIAILTLPHLQIFSKSLNQSPQN
jgi:Brp/Blh family beta-carotene 15,15'-monooxygenase